MTSIETSTTLALSTTRLPESPGGQPIVAIIKLTAHRANELLSLMKEIALLGSVSSHVFKVSSFEPRALYVPAQTLPFTPDKNNFLVLPANFEISAIRQVKIIYADVLPLTVLWQACDLHDRFTLTTPEVDSRVLQTIASGTPIFPGATRETFAALPGRSRIPAYLNLSKYADAIQ